MLFYSNFVLVAGESGKSASRSPEIIADSAYAILSKNSREFTGNFVIDEPFLRKEGVTDFEKYAMVPGKLLD